MAEYAGAVSSPRKSGEIEEQREVVASSEKHRPVGYDTGGSHHRTPFERRLLVKSDFLILPLLILTYLVAYLDRNNIGYARLMTFQKDLQMTDEQFFSCVQIFYGGYLVGIWPACLYIKRIGPNYLLGTGIVFFATCVILVSIVKNVSSVLGLRFLIGVGEAVIQSVPIYLAAWYKRNELATRIAIFYSSATLSGCFSGLIAYGIQTNMENTGGRHAWQWLYIIEGSLALGIGLLVLTMAPQFPDQIKKHWLFKRDELDYAVQRYASYNEVHNPIRLVQILASVQDPHVWMMAFVNTANATTIAAAGAFLPSIIKEFGFSTVRTQLMTIIPYAYAFVMVITVAYTSDRVNKKAFFIMGAIGSCIIGFIILMTTTNVGGQMAGACLVVGGAYPAAVAQIAWVNINVCGHTKRAISFGLSQVLGQGFSMLAAQVYIDPPRYLTGHGALLAFAAWGLINCAGAYFWMRRQNLKKDRILEEYRARGEAHPDFNKTLEEVYDQHISFRYIP